MPESRQPPLLYAEGAFSIVIAPPELLAGMVREAVARRSAGILYLCGNYPVVLPCIDRTHGGFQVRRVLNPWQAMKALEESDHSVLLFEHDPQIYDGFPELAQLAGQACREYSGGASTVLFYHRLDSLISAIEPFARHVTVIEGSPHRREKPAGKVKAGQTTLEL